MIFIFSSLTDEMDVLNRQAQCRSIWYLCENRNDQNANTVISYEILRLLKIL